MKLPLIAALLALGSAPPVDALPAQEPAAEARAAPAPTELYPVTRVVDGDTIWIEREGEREKLRLLSVDTEERMSGRGGSATKPETQFGEDCAYWAVQFFASLAKEGEKARVRLLFPGGVERRDIYGRLLCHVILEDGRDFNVLLVEEGKSPYFNKYGNSLLAHEAFVKAQEKAREKQLGIWDPETNPAPGPRRPYAKLLPWWRARADAIDAFRAKRATEPEAVFDAEAPEQLEAAAKAEGEVDVFGQVYKIFDEDDGSRTVLMRSGDRERSLRVRIAKEHLASHAGADLEGSLAEFRQNYLYVRGAVTRGARGFELVSSGPEQWRRAGPEPAAPEPK